MASANWQSFEIKLPGQDFLEGIRSILETLLIFLEILKAILDTIKSLLIFFGNPLAAIIKALISLVQAFFESLKQSGLYAWFDVPDPTKDPHFFRYQGGYQAFTNRFKGSLLDTKDTNRPQPVQGLSSSGFVLLVCDAAGILEVLRLINILLRFFGKDSAGAQFQAPANLKVLPIGPKGNPILRIAQVFSSQISGISLTWSLPGSVVQPDPSFNDIGSSVAAEFVPPNWLIEKSSVPVTSEITVGDLSSADSAGPVTYTYESEFEVRGYPGMNVNVKMRLRDLFGESIIKFQKYYVINTSSGLAGFLQGELGTFTYVDNDVEPDTVYFYRVRAFTGSLDINGTSLNWVTTPPININTKQAYLNYPGDVIMGKASPVVRIRMPLIPPNFDVMANLTNVFLAAISLNFHLPVPSGAQYGTDNQGHPLSAKFDSNGNPVAPATVQDIGKGSLFGKAGALASLLATPIVSGIVPVGALAYTFASDPVTGQSPQLPFVRRDVQYQAARLANIVGSAMLEAGSGAITSFQSMMQGSFPKGSPPDSSNTNPSKNRLSAASNLQQLCSLITSTTTSPEGVTSTDNDTFQVYNAAFNDAAVRKNVLFAVNAIKAYSLGGTPPDWIQISILRDIVPWSGAILYQILAAIQALLDAFKGIMDEIIQFISTIERKIDTLERFIKYLLSILDFILSLQAGFYTLNVPDAGSSIFSWFSIIDAAGGTPPPSGPGGYSCGIALAYAAPAAVVAPLKIAFSLIF